MRLRTLRWFVWLLFLALFAAIVLRWISLERWRWSLLHTEAQPAETETPAPTPELTPRQREIVQLLAEGRLMMSADTAEKVAALSRRISESAKQTMFRQLALWIEGAVHYDNARTAWNNAREAAVWSLIYSQRGRDVARQAEQYQQFDKQIRQTHSSRLREIMGKA